MGFTIDEIAGHKNTQNIVIYFDTAADLSAYNVENLESGSIALVLQTGDVSILNTQKVWVLQ